MTPDSTDPQRIRELFDITLTEEPPLLDMVTGAVTGAKASKRRERIGYVAAPLAVVGLVASVYAAVPDAHGGKGSGGAPGLGPVGAGAGSTPTTAKPVTIPPLSDPFANPGTPEQACQGNFPDPANKNEWRPSQLIVSVAAQKAECVANITAMRALLPGDVVVLDHEVRPMTQEAMKLVTIEQPLSTDAPGTKEPAFAAALVAILNNPADPNNRVDPDHFLVKTPNGIVRMGFLDAIGSHSGTGTCKNGKSGGETSKPCGDATLADGTGGDFVSFPGGMIEIVVNDTYGNQIFFTAWPDTYDVWGSTTSADAKWMDLETGTVHQGLLDRPNVYTKDMLLSLTGSQGFLDLFKQVAKTESGH